MKNDKARIVAEHVLDFYDKKKQQAREHSENINAIQSKLEEVKNQNTDAMKRLSDTADYQQVCEEAQKTN